MKRISKPWGYEVVYVKNGWGLKTLHVAANETIPTRCHKNKDVVYCVTEGTALILVGLWGGETKKPGSVMCIKHGEEYVIHSLYNEPCLLTEITNDGTP